MMMRFSEFAALCYQLEKTSSRLAKVALAAEYLKRLDAYEIRHGIAFLSGRPFPVSDSRTLDIGPGAFAHASQTPEIESSVSPELTLTDVAGSFSNIAQANGKGSRSAKYASLRELVEMTSSQEKPILFRLLHNELRIGLHDGLIQEAIDIKLFVPLLPMLSELSEDFDGVIAVHGGSTAFEFKYDGARVQIHKDGDQVRIWSRRLTEVTGSLPEIAQIVRGDLAGDSLILDGEVVAVGKDGRPFPFQELMRRFRRIHDIEAAAIDIPLHLHLFDCLLLNGRSLIDESYEKRWQILSELTSGKHLARRQITSDKVLAESFLKDALAAGHEGLMAKALSSPYMPGNRGKLWFKIKPAETVDCAIIAADRGSGRRRGWLSNYHLAVVDGEGGFAPVGKTFKGLTDNQFVEMTARLQNLQIADDGYTVAVKPDIVVEVAYNEIQHSPQYSSKFALRFARIKRIRDDKNVDQITTLSELQNLYEHQFISKSKRLTP
jgi:DNA ligase-1